jgi:MFS superfamily sulfate permease-like transporter
VRWFVLSAEAIIDIDITAADVLKELQAELAEAGIVFALARAKQDLLQLLRRAGVVEMIGADRCFPRLKTAVAAFRAEFPEVTAG